MTLLGARRDRQGPGRHPRDATPATQAEEKLRAPSSVSARPDRAPLDRAPSAPAGRARGREHAEARERGVRGLAALPRGAGRASGRSCSCSRTCTGPTTRCSTSSTSWRLGRRGVPLLVLVHGAARAARAAARVGRRQAERAHDLAVARSSDEETARLVAALLEQAGCSPRRRRPRCSRGPAGTRSTPSSTRACCSTRGDVVASCPETVQGIIAARLDALARRREALLQDAAVVGKVFWLGAVEAVEARRAGRPRSFSTPRAQGVRPARAPLRRSPARPSTRSATCSIRDVAYGQIPRAGRSRQARARPPRWIESLGRPEDHAEMLAHHYLQALELAEAAGLDTAALGVPAREALRDAGDRAAALYAVEAAERFYDAALRLWPHDDPERAELLFRRAVPSGRSARAIRPAWRRCATRSSRSATASRRAKRRCCLGQLLDPGHRDLADEHQRRAAALVAGAAPSRASASVLARRATRALLSATRRSASRSARRCVTWPKRWAGTRARASL